MADSTTGPRKERHGCLTTYLVLMIVANSAMALLYLLGTGTIKQRMPRIPDWAFPALAVLGIVNVICAVALFRWKMWGFWGVGISAAIAFFVNLTIGVSIISNIFSLFFSVIVLFGVLHIGKDRSGWPQLE